MSKNYSFTTVYIASPSFTHGRCLVWKFEQHTVNMYVSYSLIDGELEEAQIW